MFFSPWLLLLVEDLRTPPFGVVAFFAALSLFGALLLAGVFTNGYRADARGISWRDSLGRRRHAAWSEVREVRARHPRGVAGTHYGVIFASGRSLTWDSSWREAAALHDLALASTDRGAYRSVGDRTADVPITFGERSRFDLIRQGLTAGMALALLLGFVGGGFAVVLGVARTRGDLGAPLAFASIGLIPAVVGCLDALRTFRDWFRDPTRDVVTLDARGFRVRRGEDHASARWDEVVSVLRERGHGVDRLRVEAVSASFVAGPLALHNGIAFVVAERIPPTVRETWAASEEGQRGDRPGATAPETFRHRLRVFGFAPWLVDVLSVFLVSFPLLISAAMRPDDAPLSIEPRRMLLVAGLAALAVLVHRVARAALFIEVSPAGCIWSGLRHRRRFTWSDVVALSLPEGRDPRPLTITLSDGTRLRHLDRSVAGHAHLLLALRSRLPHLVARP
ncbi:MAG: hypothetical protein Q7V43_30365 [Myxococcales bacterium]|nr:hypothetical protein [Myxococcales bacterium]